MSRPSPPSPRVAALALLAVATLALPAAAQDALAARLEVSGAPALEVHHSFPEAGGVLRLVVEGFWPGSPVEVLLEDPASAPPSVLEALDAFFPLPTDAPELLRRGAVADDAGLLVFAVTLDDPQDAGRSFGLVFRDGEGRRTDPLELMVQPPTLLLPAADHIVRIDLRDGTVLVPDIPGRGGLLAAAFSADGFLGHLLRRGGRLETWSTRNWGGRPFAVTRLAADVDDLAHAAGKGPAFAVGRPDGAPFAPPGRLVFLDGREDLTLDPMSRTITGRRWALAEDGFTAFVAEDDLLVREVDVLAGSAHGMFTAGLPGDRAVSDLVLEADRLYVTTRREDGRPGSLTVLDLRTGWLSPFELAVDPLRLVALGDGRLLVVPAEGLETAGVLVVVEEGVPAPADRLEGGGRILDVAPVPGGAAVLVAQADGGHRLEHWDAGLGLQPWIAAPDVPEASRLLAAGDAALLLLGGGDGGVHRLDLQAGILERLPGVEASGQPLFAVIP